MDTFTTAYIEAALWSSLDTYGRPLDEMHGVDDISKECLASMVADCEAFQQEETTWLRGLDSEQCGHDFWLTRNGHGVGFWDRGLGVAGDMLTRAANIYGSVDLYVGDDGKIYCCVG
jgi:hypothetical protein